MDAAAIGIGQGLSTFTNRLRDVGLISEGDMPRGGLAEPARPVLASVQSYGVSTAHAAEGQAASYSYTPTVPPGQGAAGAGAGGPVLEGVSAGIALPAQGWWTPDSGQWASGEDVMLCISVNAARNLSVVDYSTQSTSA